MSEPLLEHDYIGLSDSSSMERSSKSSNFSTETENNNALNLKATELRLGLPGYIDENNNNKIVSTKNFFPGSKRGFSDVDVDECRNWGFNGECDADSNKVSSSSALFSPKNVNNNDLNQIEEKKNRNAHPVSKAQVVGWPPIRSFRKNTMATNLPKYDAVAENLATGGCLYVKVSMDGAPYLRKVDLKTYCKYADLSKALERLFTCFTLGSEYVVTYEDKDGDWMLVGDVPWEMFIDSCKRLRIMKGSEATGLAPRPLSIART